MGNVEVAYRPNYSHFQNEAKSKTFHINNCFSVCLALKKRLLGQFVNGLLVGLFAIKLIDSLIEEVFDGLMDELID